MPTGAALDVRSIGRSQVRMEHGHHGHLSPYCPRATWPTLCNVLPIYVLQKRVKRVLKQIISFTHGKLKLNCETVTRHRRTAKSPPTSTQIRVPIRNFVYVHVVLCCNVVQVFFRPKFGDSRYNWIKP